MKRMRDCFVLWLYQGNRENHVQALTVLTRRLPNV